MKIVLILILFGALSRAFDKENFLPHCGTTYKSISLFSKVFKCDICKNVKFSVSDSESFESQKFDILTAECVVFKDASLGVVNGDFFKQFPNAKIMIITESDLSLKPSENLIENTSLKYLEISLSDVRENNNTNALHSLKNLKSFHLTSCNLENTTIDGDLLRMNPELEELHMKLDMPIANQITEDAFDNLINLKKIYFDFYNVSGLVEKFFKDKPELRSLELIGEWKKFPNGLPESIDYILMQFSEFRKLSRENLANLKRLTRLSIISGRLEKIDLNAFDELENLQDLDLSLNEISMFSERHLKNNFKIKKVFLKDNPLDTRDLVLGHRLEGSSRGRFYKY